LASAPLVHYKVTVVTRNHGSRTDANVFIQIFGDKGNSSKQKLVIDFERNKIDVFVLEVVALGELQKIIIEHDNTGFGAFNWTAAIMTSREDTLMYS